MADEWPTCTVRQLQDAGVLIVEDGNHGESRPRPGEFTLREGTAFIRATDMSDDTVQFTSAERISEVALARITKGIGRPGDIVFSHKGTVGKLALVEPTAPPFVCSPQTTFWRTVDQNRLDRRFLFAFMRSRLFTVQWKARKGETDMADYVSLTAQRTFRVPVPDIEVQRAIGDTLEPFETEIRNGRTYGRALHTLAERLFQSWFVDLDPVATELKELAVLTKELAPLFGTAAAGSLPEGWESRPLASIARFKNGIAMQKFPPNGGSLPVLKIAQLRDGHVNGAERATSELPADVVVDDGDVVFSWSGTLMVRIWCGGRSAVNQHLFKVTSEEFPRWFYYFWTRAHLPSFQAIAADKKTTMGHIKREHLSDASVLVPPAHLLDAADRLIAPMVERYVVGELQSRRLEALRDHTLRSLMAGEIRLDAARGKLVEAAS